MCSVGIGIVDIEKSITLVCGDHLVAPVLYGIPKYCLEKNIDGIVAAQRRQQISRAFVWLSPLVI